MSTQCKEVDFNLLNYSMTIVTGDTVFQVLRLFILFVYVNKWIDISSLDRDIWKIKAMKNNRYEKWNKSLICWDCTQNFTKQQWRQKVLNIWFGGCKKNLNMCRAYKSKSWVSPDFLLRKNWLIGTYKQ